MFEQPKKDIDFVDHPRAYERAKSVLEQDRIDMESFSDLYGQEVVTADLEYVERMEEKFSNPLDSQSRILKEKAEVLEAIISREADQNMWFGENSAIILTSKFDDIKNGIDAVIEFEKEEGISTLGLAVDVTFGNAVGKKMDKIEQSIREGKKTSVKYFESELGDFRGELRNIAKVIVGVDGRTEAELENFFAERKGSDFANHQVQLQILEEIIIQCEYFKSIAEEVRRENVFKSYDRALKIISKLLEERKEVVSDTGERDSFLLKLKTHIKRKSY